MHRGENKTAPSIFLKILKIWNRKEESIVFLLETRYLEQHFDSSRKKSPKIQEYYKGKTSFTENWNKLFLNRQH